MTFTKSVSGGRGVGRSVGGPTKWFIALAPSEGTPVWNLSDVYNGGMLFTQDTSTAEQGLAAVTFDARPVRRFGFTDTNIDGIVVGAHPTQGFAVAVSGDGYSSYGAATQVNLVFMSRSGDVLWRRYGDARTGITMVPKIMVVTDTAVYYGWNRGGVGVVSRNLIEPSPVIFDPDNIGGRKTVEFTLPPSTSLAGIATDASENLYTVGQNTDAAIVSGRAIVYFKFDSAGTLQFQNHVYSRTTGANTCIGMRSNLSGSNVIGYQSTSACTVAVFNSSGTLQWARTLTTATISGVEIDEDGNVFALGSDATTGIYLAKWNSSGTLQWQKKIARASTTSASSGDLFLDFKGRLCFAATINSIRYVMRFPDAPPNGTYTVNSVDIVVSTSTLTSASTTPTVVASTYVASTLSQTYNDLASFMYFPTDGPYKTVGAYGGTIGVVDNSASKPVISSVYRGRTLT